MPTSTDQIIKILKSKGLRITPQRFGVYSNLLHRSDHPTAEQILKDLNQNAPTLSQATIYLCLQTLRDVGLIRVVLLEEGICRYDANTLPHHHFRCRCCGQVEDIAWESFSNLSLHKLPSGLKVEKYEVTIEGKCNDCEY